MDVKVCFVCGGSVSNAEIYLSVGKTRYSKTTYPTKLCQLVGDDIMVVVSKEDKLCQRCATLINRFDQLEIDLLKIKTLITGFLSEKYNIGSEENIEYASEELEYSKEANKFQDKDALEVSTLKTFEDVSSLGGYEQLSPLTVKKKELNNNPSLKLITAPEQYFDCTLVKSETFRDYWSDQSLKTTNINLINDGSKDLAKCKESSTILSLTETTYAYNNDALGILSPVCKSNIATSTFQGDYSLQEVKKETDSLDHSNINILCDGQQIKTATERFKLENGNINNHCDLPNNKLSTDSPLAHLDKIVSTNESHSNSDSVNTDTKLIAKNVLAVKTKHSINFKCYKRKLRPILPKTNGKLLQTNLFAFDHITKLLSETNLRPKKLESPISNQENVLGNKCAKAVSLYEEHSKSDLINNIKEEAVQDKVIGKYCCRLCKTEFEDIALLKNHMKQHYKNGTSFCCCFCSKTFKSKSGLYRHTATNHTKKFRFCCEICGRGFTSQSSLEAHHSSHTKEQVYVCDICGKKFNSRGTHWIHRKWHFDPLPYRCSECGQLFKHSSLLSLHKRRKHTGERPYKCPYCILTFNVSSTFKRHLILHTKNYPYNCGVCKQGFTTSFKYTEHMLKAHSVIIDKPNVDKKNYKVAVYDANETAD